MKITQITIVVGVVLIVAALLFLSVFWSRFTPFYKDCTRIAVGMDVPEVESILQPYLSDDRFTSTREGALWGPGIYVTSNASGNHCDVAIENGVVTKINPYFE